MEISEECTVIAFYGVDVTTQVVACFYDTVVGWFKEMGHPPDKAAIRGSGHSGKFVSFERADGAIRKNGIVNVVDFELYALNAGSPNDYLLEAMCSKRYSFIYVVGRSSIAPLFRSDTLMLAKKMAECGNPEYGIGYIRDHHLGPSYYVSGISQ